jgi:hypothetical protein
MKEFSWCRNFQHNAPARIEKRPGHRKVFLDCQHLTDYRISNRGFALSYRSAIWGGAGSHRPVRGQVPLPLNVKLVSLC